MGLSAFPAALHAETPMSAEDFEAFFQGRTVAAYDEAGLYEEETFLPGGKTFLRSLDRCRKGEWWVEGRLICFTYENDPQSHCWGIYDRGSWAIAWPDDDRRNMPLVMKPSVSTFTCEGFLGT